MANQSGSFGMNMTVAGIKRQFPDVKNVDTETLDQWMKERSVAGAQSESTQQIPSLNHKLVIFDVRPAEEFAVSFIPTALRVDPDERDMQKLMQKVQETHPTSDPDQPLNVVMYCSVGYRSSALAVRLQNFVTKQDKPADISVYNLEGSIFKWANEGRPLEDLSGGETQFVHPYSKIFGLLLDKRRRRYSPV